LAHKPNRGLTRSSQNMVCTTDVGYATRFSCEILALCKLLLTYLDHETNNNVFNRSHTEKHFLIIDVKNIDLQIKIH